ncbi:hypothetical protein GGQ22_10440 [Nocardioides sp. zg-579]|uniref:DMT family transporter n=1 Tax=Nocardioides marmotae TaxID=2663857 RepID=A0A6I3JBH6_9ACTN|nr:hypothetical protein [Nocardioides marmotae]MCR6031861.1 hypothetical protein [Gordonia jinghuaiqii]MTB95502.1 hypothetical protein [Nocardioides marmotae]QKE00933.1 hypothetical protein HPC71_07500 [Nocardioides marmotae]
MSWLGLLAGLGGALLFGLGAVAQAHGVRRSAARPTGLLGFLATSVRDPWTMGVVAAYLAGFVLHAVAIWLLPLYLAQAATAMSFPVTALAVALVGERLRASGWLAVVVVTAGLVLLAAGSGEAGPVVTDPAFVPAVWLGVVVLAALALAGRHLGAGVLGTLAGLGYAGSAIAVRGTGTPVDLAVVAVALAVPAYSVVAFWLYSLGLHSDQVSAATAPMIVGQTFVPSLVGVLLLGDGVREGWGPAVAAGLLLSTAGAAWLAAPRTTGAGLRRDDAAATASSPGPAARPGPAPRRSP